MSLCVLVVLRVAQTFTVRSHVHSEREIYALAMLFMWPDTFPPHYDKAPFLLSYHSLYLSFVLNCDQLLSQTQQNL